MAVTPLGELIEECKQRFYDTHGVELSNGDISSRGGHVIGRKRVQQLAKDPIPTMPPAPTLRALALGLGVTEAVVIERALASTGYGEYGVAARLGIPRQVRQDAAEPDPNVDPEGPEAGA